MEDNIFTQDCFTCGKQYQMSAGRYDGENIKRFQFGVCNTCYEANWDGWNPRFEQKILKHLEEHNITPPERNDKGLFPRD